MKTILLPAHYMKPIPSITKPSARIVHDGTHISAGMGAEVGMEGYANVEVIDAKTEKPVEFPFMGRRVKETGWIPNLIQNWGMNRFLSQRSMADMPDGDSNAALVGSLRAGLIGTGSSFNKIASGSVTASQSGTTVTVSSPIPELTIGKQIKWATGETAMLVGLIDSQNFIANESQTVSAGVFDIYITDRTDLENRVRTAITDQSTRENFASGFRRYTVRYTFGVESSAINYNEFGTSPSANAPQGSLFTRVLFPSSVTVEAGQQLRVTYRFEAYINPSIYVSGGAVIPMSIAGWDLGEVRQGVFHVERFLRSMLMNNWSIAGHSTSGFPTNIFNSGLATTFSAGSSTLGGYTNLSFQRSDTSNASVSQINRSDIRGFALGSNLGGYGFGCFFENTQTKEDTHTLSVTTRVSVSRALV